MRQWWQLRRKSLSVVSTPCSTPTKKVNKKPLKILLAPLKWKDNNALPTLKSDLIATYNKWHHRPPLVFNDTEQDIDFNEAVTGKLKNNTPDFNINQEEEGNECEKFDEEQEAIKSMLSLGEFLPENVETFPI